MGLRAVHLQWGAQGPPARNKYKCRGEKTLCSTYTSEDIFFYKILIEQGMFKIVAHPLGAKTHKTKKVTARTLPRFL